MNKQELEAYRKAGKIAKQIREYAKKLIKLDMPLLEIANKIETQIEKLGAKPAFPVGLGIDDVAAHYTPSSTDKPVASGLLNVDIGVHINGYIADTAFSLDLTKNQEHKEVIEASKQALDKAIQEIKQKKQNITLSEIGSTIQKTISGLGFSPIRNLSGHSLGKNLVHAGITIPSYEKNNENKLDCEAFAIEPFATTGEGLVYDAGKSSIYRIEKQEMPRDKTAREIYQFILEEYETLPFCERWLTKKFGSRTRLALLFLEKQGILHHYAQLVEKSHKAVSQAEHTLIIHKDKVEVTTE